MAIQDKTLSGAEHDWYATRSGQPSGAPLSQHKAAFYASKGFTANTITQAEREWLQTIATSSSNNEGDLWREAVAAQGLTPSASTSENKFLFFTGVADSPPA
jgi:hypothetical protein